ELPLSPYVSLSFTRENEAHFVTADDPSVQRVARHGADLSLALVLPVAEQDGPVPYNTAVVLARSGTLIGRYRKLHLPASFPTPPGPPISTYERLAFAPGNTGLPTFDLDGIRVGVQICYDLNFPEGCRQL